MKDNEKEKHMAGTDIVPSNPEQPVVVQSYSRRLPKVRQPNKVVMDETWTTEEPEVIHTYRRRQTWERRDK